MDMPGRQQIPQNQMNKARRVSKSIIATFKIDDYVLLGRAHFDLFRPLLIHSILS